jgi:hypothetical protein
MMLNSVAVAAQLDLLLVGQEQLLEEPRPGVAGVVRVGDGLTAELLAALGLEDHPELGNVGRLLIGVLLEVTLDDVARRPVELLVGVNDDDARQRRGLELPRQRLEEVGVVVVGVRFEPLQLGGELLQPLGLGLRGFEREELLGGDAQPGEARDQEVRHALILRPDEGLGQLDAEGEEQRGGDDAPTDPRLEVEERGLEPVVGGEPEESLPPDEVGDERETGRPLVRGEAPALELPVLFAELVGEHLG